MTTTYDHAKITFLAQEKWQQRKAFKAEAKPERNKKCYVLSMFPYPSGKIHMGHVRNYVIGDIIARYKRCNGYSVLHPIGWDAFGLPAENAAITNKVNPQQWTVGNIDDMRAQLKKLGISYDWSRELATCDPQYFAQEQEFFLKMLQGDLVYQKESMVNWDPVDQTVLANEQVIDGKGWRSGAAVEKKNLKQWFVRASKYAESLDADLASLPNWPVKVKHMQQKWIGKSQGAIIRFPIIPGPGASPISEKNMPSANQGQNAAADLPKYLEIFTTRPETIVGASFCALALQHPLAQNQAQRDQKLQQFVKKHLADADSHNEMEKHGYLLEIKAINPVTQEPLPVYATNFIVVDYGLGAIFGCPAHDARDFEFATKYNLTIKKVVENPEEQLPYTGEGRIGEGLMFAGLSVQEARIQMVRYIEKLGFGKAATQYRLRDWGVSRQRYWGCPIPIVHCDNCGAVPVPEHDLPVLLPKDIDLNKIGNHLALHPTWKDTPCPKCGAAAQRETDTLDTFFESSWYYLAFCSPDFQFSEANCQKWMPVDYYIGGIEHAILHLLYSRMFCRILRDIGYKNIPSEPFQTLITQGMVCHKTFCDTKGNWLFPSEAANRGDVIVGNAEKMSKSKKNVVEPESIVNHYGVDVVRMFVVSDTPPEKDLEWSDSGIAGVWRFINKLWEFLMRHREILQGQFVGIADILIKIKQNHSHSPNYSTFHKAIKNISSHMEQGLFNCAIADIRALFNLINKDVDPEFASKAVVALLKMLDVFIPHTTQALWEAVNNRSDCLLCQEPWPEYDQKAATDTEAAIAVQVDGKLRHTIAVPVDSAKDTVFALAIANAKVANHLDGKEIARVIFVPNRIINIVTKTKEE